MRRRQEEAVPRPAMRPDTTFLLMAQYNSAALIPLEWVRRDYFSYLSMDKLKRQILAGRIALPLVRITNSQKSALAVHLADLASYIDGQRAKALKESRQLMGEDDDVPELEPGAGG